MFVYTNCAETYILHYPAFLQVIFSSLWEIAVPFTRDYDSIKTAADNIQLYDKTCLESAFTSPLEVIQNMWGNNMSCQVGSPYLHLTFK